MTPEQSAKAAGVGAVALLGGVLAWALWPKKKTEEEPLASAAPPQPPPPEPPPAVQPAPPPVAAAPESFIELVLIDGFDTPPAPSAAASLVPGGYAAYEAALGAWAFRSAGRFLSVADAQAAALQALSQPVISRPRAALLVREKDGMIVGFLSGEPYLNHHVYAVYNKAAGDAGPAPPEPSFINTWLDVYRVSIGDDFSALQMGGDYKGGSAELAAEMNAALSTPLKVWSGPPASPGDLMSESAGPKLVLDVDDFGKIISFIATTGPNAGGVVVLQPSQGAA